MRPWHWRSPAPAPVWQGASGAGDESPLTGTTLQKASRRLLELRHIRPLIARTVRLIQRRRRNVPHAAGDSSGFDAHHASRYFIWRRDNQKQDVKRPKRRQRYRRFGKLMVIVDCRSHAILAAVASEGPTPDIDQLEQWWRSCRRP